MKEFAPLKNLKNAQSSRYFARRKKSKSYCDRHGYQANSMNNTKDPAHLRQILLMKTGRRAQKWKKILVLYFTDVYVFDVKVIGTCK